MKKTRQLFGHKRLSIYRYSFPSNVHRTSYTPVKDIQMTMREVTGVSRHFSLKALRFFMRTVGMWPVENSCERLISNFALFYTTAVVTIGVTAQSIDLYYSLGDLHAISFNIPNTFTAVIELVKLVKFIINRREIMNFNAYTAEKFWNGEYNSDEYQILDECNRKSVIMVIVHFFFAQSVAALFVTIPIVESLGLNASERILPISVYFNFPFTESPYYEILFILEMAAAIAVGLCTTTFASYLGTTNFYTAGQFKILQRRLEHAFHTTESVAADKSIVTMKIKPNYRNLRNCIKQHQMLILYMERIENIFSIILLTQTTGSALSLCFSGFQIVLNDAKSSILRFLFSAQFIIIISVQLFLFAWPCQQVIVESQAVAQGAYQALWYCLPYNEEGKMCRDTMMIVIMRASKPCVITVGKFTPMSLQTFGSVFNTALSYFTVVRQMEVNKNE